MNTCKNESIALSFSTYRIKYIRENTRATSRKSISLVNWPTDLRSAAPE
jgi:hypothetical protein